MLTQMGRARLLEMRREASVISPNFSETLISSLPKYEILAQPGPLGSSGNPNLRQQSQCDSVHLQYLLIGFLSSSCGLAGAFVGFGLAAVTAVGAGAEGAAAEADAAGAASAAAAGSASTLAISFTLSSIAAAAAATGSAACSTAAATVAPVSGGATLGSISSGGRSSCLKFSDILSVRRCTVLASTANNAAQANNSSKSERVRWLLILGFDCNGRCVQ